MIFETNPEAGKITMRGGIGDFEGHISADDFIAAIADHSGPLEISLDSPGGSVTDGLSIYNAIRNYDGEVTVHIDTLAASIATVVACAADRVKINANGKFMIHRAWTIAMGNCKEFRSMADLMEMMDGDIADVYSDRTGLAKDDLLAMMDSETWLDSASAKDMGFVDEVVEVGKKPQAKAPAEIVAIAPSVRIEAAEHARRLRVKYKI